MEKRRIIIDTNLWISFLIGKRLSTLKSLLVNQGFSVFVCDELLEEIRNISSKQKIRKYVGENDINDTFDVIDKFCRPAIIKQKTVSSDLRDANDLYLLSLADTINEERRVKSEELRKAP